MTSIGGEDRRIRMIGNPLLEAKYVGFITIAGVTGYELAIKDIFVEFAKKKHKVLGNFTEKYFERVNGRIRAEDIRKRYLPNFGEKYVIQFNKQLQKASFEYLKANKRDIISSYGNLITWRHEFAYAGIVNLMATYQEAAQAYEDGKVVIDCLARAMIL